MKCLLVDTTKDQEIKVTEDTQFVLNPGGGNIAKIDFVFEKEGVEAQILGVYRLKKEEKTQFETSAIHKVPNTKCDVQIKGVLEDKTSSDYIGKIVIEPKAQQTSSFLEDNVLVIGQNTHNNSQPILEIEADDVKASHGATTGRIEEEEVYYLMTRGLSRVEAENLVVEGFLTEILEQIVDENVKAQVKLNLEVE